jgi:hypothetical protein
MTRICLRPKSSSMRFGYSYFTGHEVFNLWFVKHTLHNCTRINLNHSRCLWWGQWELKASKYQNFGGLLNLQSLLPSAKGPFFYFYVESPPSTFMHRLREHSCYSDFNVHCPKVYHWLIHVMVLLVLKLFVSSRPLKLEGVLCIYVLLFHKGQAENHFTMFFYMIWTHTWLSMFHYSWSFICVTFYVITWLLSFIVKIISLLPMF